MADRVSSVQVSVKGKVDPSLEAAMAAASAQIKGFAASATQLTQAEAQALEAAVAQAFENAAPKAAALAATAGTIAPALESAAAGASELGDAAGAVSFRSLQEGIDASLRLDQNLSNARKSATAFSAAMSANAGFDAARREATALAADLDALAAKEALAARNAAMGQAIANAYAGVKTEFASAAASAAVFEAAMAPQASQAALARDVRNAFADEATAAGAIGDALAIYGSSAAKAEEATRMMHGPVSTATREFRALFDELSSGRTRQTPGTLAIIATQVFGLGPAALAALAGVAALTGGLAYYVYRVHEAAEATNQLQATAKNAGNFDIPKEQLQQFEDKLSKFPTITHDAAREVIAAYAGMRNQTEPQMRALIDLTGEWAYQTGQKAPEAAKQLAETFSNENLSFDQLKKVFPQITTAMFEHIEAAQRVGDMHTRNAELLKLLDQEVNSSVDLFHEHNASMFASVSTFGRYVVTGHSVIGQQVMHNQILKEQAQKWREDDAAVRGYISALMGLQQPTESIIEQAKKAADSEDTLGVRVRQVKADIETLKAGIDAATKSGDTDLAARLTQGLKAAQDNLTKLGARQGKLDMFGVTLAGEQAIEAARQTVSEIDATEGLSAQERLAKTKAVWASLLQGEQLNAKQRADVIIQMNEAQAAYNKQMDGQIRTSMQTSAENDVELSRMVIEEKKKLLEDDFANHRITAAQKAALLTQYVNEEYAASMDILQMHYLMAGDDVAAKEQALAQIKALEQQNRIDIANIHRQETKDYKTELDEQTRAKQQQIRGLLSAEDTLVRGIFNANQTLTQSLLQMSAQFLQKEIAADLKYLTQRIFMTQAEIAASRTAEQGGLLFHTTIEAQKTAATEVGAQARVAAEETAGKEGMAADAARGSAKIMNDAHEAFTGAYKAVVGIPYVGPVLAPIAGATAFAAVAAMDVLTSAEGGDYRVSEGLYHLHEAESVIPATVANPMRDFFETGGRQGGDTHVHLHNNFSSMAPKSAMRFMKNRQILRSMSKDVGRYMTLNTSARGDY